MLSLPNPKILVLKIPDIVQIYLNSRSIYTNPEILVLKIPDLVDARCHILFNGIIYDVSNN